MKKLALAVAVFVALVFNIFYNQSLDPSNSIDHIDDTGPKIETVLQTSVESIQSQSKLIVMTSRLNAIATSQTQRMGMVAKQTDITSREVQYQLNLKDFNKSMIHIGSDIIQVKLPRHMIKAVYLPNDVVESFDNNSWLFGITDVKTELSLSNKTKLESNIISQGNAILGIAEQNACQSVKALLEIPLEAMGISKTVQVSFVKTG